VYVKRLLDPLKDGKSQVNFFIPQLNVSLSGRNQDTIPQSLIVLTSIAF
jgi:hypothetical protein